MYCTSFVFIEYSLALHLRIIVGAAQHINPCFETSDLQKASDI